MNNFWGGGLSVQTCVLMHTPVSTCVYAQCTRTQISLYGYTTANLSIHLLRVSWFLPSSGHCDENHSKIPMDGCRFLTQLGRNQTASRKGEGLLFFALTYKDWVCFRSWRVQTRDFQGVCPALIFINDIRFSNPGSWGSEDPRRGTASDFSAPVALSCRSPEITFRPSFLVSMVFLLLLLLLLLLWVVLVLVLSLQLLALDNGPVSKTRAFQSNQDNKLSPDLAVWGLEAWQKGLLRKSTKLLRGKSPWIPGL